MTTPDRPSGPLRARQRRRYPRAVRAVLDIGRDIGLAGLTLALGLLAVVMPRRVHRLIVRSTAKLGGIFGRNPRRELSVEQSFCRGYGVYRRGWPAEVKVTGLEHVRSTHTSGNGVVMWVMGFLDQTALNLALEDAGYPVSFLWAENHGTYSSRALSRRVAAPILVRGAVRAVENVVIIPEDGNLSYVRQLCTILEKEGGTIGIKGDVTGSRATVDAPYWGQVTAFPTGAPSLAHMTGAQLLTGAVLRRGLLEHEVVFDEPIDVPRDLGRKEFVQASVVEFARRLEQRVMANPTSRPATRFDKPDPKAVI